MLTNNYQYRELLTAVKEQIRSSQVKSRITQALPAELKSNIPTIEEFEKELNRNL